MDEKKNNLIRVEILHQSFLTMEEVAKTVKCIV